MKLFRRLKLFLMLFFLIFLSEFGFSYTYDGWQVKYSHPYYGTVMIPNFGPVCYYGSWLMSSKGWLSICMATSRKISVIYQ